MNEKQRDFWMCTEVAQYQTETCKYIPHKENIKKALTEIRKSLAGMDFDQEIIEKHKRICNGDCNNATYQNMPLDSYDEDYYYGQFWYAKEQGVLAFYEAGGVLHDSHYKDAIKHLKLQEKEGFEGWLKSKEREIEFAFNLSACPQRCALLLLEKLV